MGHVRSIPPSAGSWKQGKLEDAVSLLNQLMKINSADVWVKLSMLLAEFSEIIYGWEKVTMFVSTVCCSVKSSHYAYPNSALWQRVRHTAEGPSSDDWLIML